MKKETRRLWVPDELAEYLGVPVKTLYRWRLTGYGPEAIRVGKHLRWTEESVAEWLDAQKASA